MEENLMLTHTGKDWGKPKDEDELVEYIKVLYKQSKDWRSPYEDKCDKAWKNYNSYRQANDYPMISNLFIPYTFSLVEGAIPKLLLSIFNAKPIVSFIQRYSDDSGLSTLMENLIDFQFEEPEMEFYFNMEEFFKSSAIFGTGFAQVVPKFENDANMTFNYIDLRPLDWYEVFPDPRATSLRTMKYVILEKLLEYDEIWLKAEQGVYPKDLVRELLNECEMLTKVDEQKKERASSIDMVEDYGFDPRRKIIKILEYWDRDEKIVIAANRHRSRSSRS